MAQIEKEKGIRKSSPLKGQKRPQCSNPSVFKGIVKGPMSEDIKKKISLTKTNGGYREEEIMCSRIFDKKEMSVTYFKRWLKYNRS